MSLANKEIYQNGAIREFEKPEVREAIKVANANRWTVCLSPIEWDEREARLKKEYEKNTKAPVPGEEQPKEGNLKAATKMFGAQAREIMRLKAENAELRETIDKMKEGNPAIKEALEESATQFNDALLDEQAKKIAELTKEKANLEDQITVLNACKKHNDKIDRKQIKCLGKEINKLNSIIHDKNAILSDVAEELRLSKIREKNLTELCQKYIKANEELKEKLANKVVDKIDAQALKSAESALAYKEKVIADLTHKLKDKHKRYVWYKGAYDAAQQILNTIADYAAKHPDKKISDPMVEKNHPTIDNPEEIEIEKAVKLVRKAMKEGHTVTINYRD